MKLELSEKQYLTLIKLAYLGNWMVNSIREGEAVEKEFDDLEEYIFANAKDFNAESVVEFSTEESRHFLAKDFEDALLTTYVDDYDEEIFWQELMHRLAERDIIDEYGEEAVNEMENAERMERKQPYMDKYSDEFEVNGLQNLELTAE